MSHPLDDSLIVEQLFYPRGDLMSEVSPDPKIADGKIAVDGAIELGYRLYTHTPESPLILFFHGNGEIASDYDGIASFYFATGASLLVVDYRGYGWSTGTPLTTQLLADALTVLQAIPAVRQKHGLADSPLIVKGRSLGSACAIYLASHAPQQMQALIIDSGFTDAPSLFARLGIPISDEYLNNPQMPFNNVSKIQQVHVPVLIIHGERDEIFPFTHAQALFDHCASTQKKLVKIRNAGHNNIMMRDISGYFGAISQLIQPLLTE